MRHHHHPRCEKPNPRVKLVFGAFVIFIGLMLLFRNTGLLSWQIYDVVFSWQSFLIGLGIIFVIGRHSFVTGVILISVGAFFMLPRIFYNLPFNFSELFWPIILIIIGGAIIMKRQKRLDANYNESVINTENDNKDSSSDFVNEIAIFGGSKHQIMNNNLRGGKITAIFGGAELDFRPSKLASGQKTLEVTCLFGGVSMIVPTDWNVQVNVVSILGGFVDKRFIPAEYVSDETKTIVIKGVAIFGGGDIKSH